MAQNCNRIIAFDAKTLETKSSLGRLASISVHAALSSCFKAIEALEMRRISTGAEVVYLQAAIAKFEEAVQALRGMRNILVTGELSREAADWLQALDYDRLYESGTARHLIPASAEQWDRLVGMSTSLNHLAVTDSLIADVQGIQQEIGATAEDLGSSKPGSALTGEQVERLLRIRTDLVQFATFAQMVAYLNAIEPMSEEWRRSGTRIESLPTTA